MQRWMTAALTGVLVGGCAWGPEDPPFDTTASVRELMALMVDPAADLVWDAVGTVITEEGVDHWEPTTDEDWLAVQLGAMAISEAGNLMMIEPRARDQDAWMRLSQGLVEAGREVLAAADARDADAVFDLGETVYNACDRCHNLYWVGDEARGRVVADGS